VAGILTTQSLGADAAPSLALMDVGWAVDFLGTNGLTSIQLRLRDPSQAAAVADTLRSELDPSLVVEAPRTRSLQVQRMLDGFQLNLTALSMVSALVGVFLIYNTVSASVVRRRREIGILRANGASRRQIFALFLSEGLILGLPGVILGLPLGIALAQALAGSVSETISSHYVLIDVARAVVPPGHLLLAAVYGLGSSLAGAWLPAREASCMSPLEALPAASPCPLGRSAGPEISRLWPRGARRLRNLLLAGALHGAGVVEFRGLLLFGDWLCPGDALSSRLIAAGLRRLLASFPFAVLPRIAVENFDRSWNRSTITVAALMTALSMTIGVSVMVSSFRETVAAWVGQSMKADLYVTPASNEVTGFQDFLPEGFLEAVSRDPAVRSVETYRQVPLTLPDRPPFLLAALGNPFTDGLRFAGGDRERKLRAWDAPGAALATEPLARRLGLTEGDALTIPTPSGPVTLTIAGIYYDYSDDRGKLVVRREQFFRWWRDDRMHSLAVLLKPGADAQALRASVSGNIVWLG